MYGETTLSKTVVVTGGTGFIGGWTLFATAMKEQGRKFLKRNRFIQKEKK